MGEPGGAGVWLEILESSEILEPSGSPGVPELPAVPEPSGISQPSGVPGVPEPTPPPEVLEGLLRQRFGPLPQPAAIARLRRGPAGAYEPTGDPAEALERRQAANAKERERIRNLNSGFSQLRTLVPLVPRDRRPSKADILRAAAQYIHLLQGVLQDTGGCQVFPDIPKNPGGAAGVSPDGQVQGSSPHFRGHAPVLEPCTP